MHGFFKTFLLFCGSLIFGLIVVEFILRGFVPVRNVGPSFSEYDSVYGKSHKKNFSCTRITPEFTMSFTTNSFGFRGPEPTSFPKNGILFIGDSYTEGYGVNDDEEFPALIRRALNSQFGNDVIPVINSGHGNTGTGRWLKFLRREGEQFAPRMVILQICDNDFYDDVVEGMFTLHPGDSLSESPPAPHSKSRFVQKLIETIPGLSNSYIAGLLRQAFWFTARRSEESTNTEETDLLTYRIVNEILSYCNQKNWKTAVMLVGLEKKRSSRLAEVVHKNAATLIETPSIQESAEWFYEIDQHWNAQGHQFAARKVFEVIKNSGILPPPMTTTQMQ